MIQARLLEQFKDYYRIYGRLFSSPGRINLIGEHTDYNEGFVMPTNTDQQFYVVMAKHGGLDPYPVIRIFSPQFNEAVEFDLFNPPKKQWALYFYGVIKEMKKRGEEIQSVDLLIHSDIPTGAGMSSSAALCVAFAKGLNSLFNLGFAPLDLALIAQATEHNYIGVQCGLMDQMASLFGKKDHFMKLDCRSYDFEQIPFDFSDLSIVLFNSRVKHNLASSEYNLRRASCERVVGIISQKKEGVTALRDLSLDDLSQFKALIDPIDYMRAEYVLEENGRVHQMVDAIKAKNLPLMGKLMAASHLGLKEKYEVSCPELDFLVDSAYNTPGIVGARMMGGGFGGCTINLVENAQKEQFIEAMTIKFEKKYLKTALYYVTTPIDI